MATTTEEAPSGEPRVQPNFSAIEKILAPNGELDNAEKKQAEAMSGLAHIHKRIEKDFHGNRGAAQLIRKMDKMSADKRNDFIRTLEPLLVSRGYTLEVIDPEDLVGNPPPKPPSGGGGEDNSTTEDAGGSAQSSDEARSNMSGPDALAAARAKLSSGASMDKGSVQLRRFLGAVEAGQGVSEAALHAGISTAEAESTMKARDAGELEDVEVIPFEEPKGTKGRPKLGMVAGGKQ